jgi:hypothetical protein
MTTAVVSPPSRASAPAEAQPKWMTITGWALTGLVSALLTLSAVFKIAAPPFFREGAAPLGYPDGVWLWIGLVELGCAVVYLYPRTAVVGAILLTGYLGGATATHVRIEDAFLGPVIIGAVVWLGIFLREPRLRALLPLRTSP